MKMSPSFILNLIDEIEKVLWAKYENSKYKKVRYYLKRWQKVLAQDEFVVHHNFEILNQENSSNIDLPETLNNISDDELLIKIAIDLGIEVPTVIYSIPVIKNAMAKGYEEVHIIFEDAIKNLYDAPDISVSMANSALETIIKKICNDKNIESCNNKDTLYDLTQHILKSFNYFPNKEIEQNIRNIGSGLLKVCQSIESLRSNHTKSHGKLKEYYLIDDPLYSTFVVNAVTTIGLFLINYHEKKNKIEAVIENEIPF